MEKNIFIDINVACKLKEAIFFKEKNIGNYCISNKIKFKLESDLKIILKNITSIWNITEFVSL